LAPNTVEFHLRQIYRKLGVRSRAQLAATLAREAAPEPPADLGPDLFTRRALTPLAGSSNTSMSSVRAPHFRHD
jgi:hypothetical protein